MLIALETKSSDVLEKYLVEFEHPETLSPSFKNILALWMYGMYFERKVYRIDNIVIFSQKGYIEQLSGYILLMLTFGAFTAIFLQLHTLLVIDLFLQLHTLLVIDLFLMIPCMMFLSPKYHLFAKIRKLIVRGHREKIGFVSKNYLIQQFLLLKRD